MARYGRRGRISYRRKRKVKGWVWNPRMKRWVKRKVRGKGFLIRKSRPK